MEICCCRDCPKRITIALIMAADTIKGIFDSLDCDVMLIVSQHVFLFVLLCHKKNK
jgi:hypothetical protein